MTYDEAVRYLMALGAELAAPRQPAAAATVAKIGLRNITLVAGRMGAPHRAVPCAHVAGTNGKGSTAAMLESILRAAGMRTGLFTSPHLERINERIRVNGQPVADAEFAAAFTRVAATIEELLAEGALAAHPTFFECVTALAFGHFRSASVDFAVYEVGMGGRLDSTNLVLPEVAAITQIDFDHENYLGHSIEEIAAEKAGIIKPGAWVVSAAGRGAARAVIARRCAEQNARLVDVDAAYRLAILAPGGGLASAQRVVVEDAAGWRLEFSLPLAGRFQARNAATAIAAARLLAERGFPLDDAAILGGLEAVRWPGRLEQVSSRPDVILDGTHNPAGAGELAAWWQERLAGRRVHLIFGAVRDKAVDEIAGLLFPLAESVILTAPRQPRAISARALHEMTAHHARAAEVAATPAEALDRALARAAPDGVVLATGSLYLAGELRRAVRSAAAAAGQAAQ